MDLSGHVKNQKVKPVLVTGSPRSGTTWLGHMLALSPLMNYLHEPFNPDVKSIRPICNIAFKQYFTYICEENGSEYYPAIKNMMESRYNLATGLKNVQSLKDLKNVLYKWRRFNRLRKSGGFPLIKDPIALMSCEWLNRHFDIYTVIMIRHPGAFVASMKRLGWAGHPETWALPQNLLMRDYFAPFDAEIRALQSGEHDIIERASLAWKLHHHVIQLYQAKYKDWMFIRHEDISLNPITSFEKLYDWAALPITPEIKKSIEDYCSPSNPSSATGKEIPIKLNSQANISNWKSKLTPAEIDRVRTSVEDVSKHFYTDADWALKD